MTPDERIGRVAGRQRGRVTTAQLLDAGLTERELRRRVERGLLLREHRGVFALAHLAPIPFAAEQAALLAAGEAAVLSHVSAAAVWRLMRCAVPVHLTVQGEGRSRTGIAVHRSALERREVRTVEGLRTTAPARTLVDLAAVVDLPALERAVAEAHALNLIRPGDVTPRAGARGAARLRAALDDQPGVTRSEAERIFLRLVRRAGLPPPETNVRVAGFEVDALWRRERLAVEIDGYATHAHRRRFERDHRKDAALRAAGFEPHRYTARMLEREPEAVVADVARGLR